MSAVSGLMTLGECGRSKHQHGFTMVEVLVTFLILAIGVLGIISLLVTSKSSQFEAVQRARAVAMADSIVEKIRSNPRAIASYVTGLDNAVAESDPGTQPDPNCDTVAACTTAQRAAQDIWQWQRDIRGEAVTIDGVATSGLVDPHACILFEPWNTHTQSGQLTVLIQWTGLLDTGDAVPVGGDVCGDGQDAGQDDERRGVAVRTFVVDQLEL